MQQTTGCKINVSQASGADIEREIGLVGTPQAIADAKQAIWDKVDSVVSELSPGQKPSTNDSQKEKNGSGYGNRRGGGGGGAGRDNFNDNYSQQQQQPAYGQPQGGAMPQAQGGAAPPADPAADPYAPYGGYQNYLAMWYSSFAQQQQQGGAPPGAA